jgi:hypothetical protein
MIHPVASVPHADPTPTAATLAEVSAKSAAQSQKSAASRAPSTATRAADTVQISTAAQLALQEALETPPQTAKEAASGDRQAQRLLAREAAAGKVR